MALRDLFRRTSAPSVASVPDAAPEDRSTAAPSSAPTPGAVLRSFPLKLAVMQPLMYEPGAVLPAFTMPPSMHPGAPVEDWFRGFMLTAEQLASVTTLRLSRTNEIYRQLDPRWAATDDRFDITTVCSRDLDLLSGLVEVRDPEGMLGAEARASFAERGVGVR